MSLMPPYTKEDLLRATPMGAGGVVAEGKTRTNVSIAYGRQVVGDRGVVLHKVFAESPKFVFDVQVGFKKVHEAAVVPTYAHGSGDSCIDLYAVESYDIYAGDIVKIRTGLILSIPVGWGGFIHGRSGLAVRGLDIMGGVIDSNYRDEVCVILQNARLNGWQNVDIGDRVAQIEFRPVYRAEFVETEEMDSTEREGGFGSTGK